MIKLRIQGLPEEVATSVEQVKKVFRVLELSTPYPNRNGEYVRVYADVEPKSDPAKAAIIREHPYLVGLTDETMKWVAEVVETEGLNLYHSVAAVIQGKRSGTGYEDKLTYYLEKYIPRRGYLEGNEDKIRELFAHVYGKIQRKQR